MHTYLGKIGELILKGSNIKTFERALVANTKMYLKGLNAAVTLNSGRLYIECDDEACGRVEWTLRHLIGITGWAEAIVTEKSMEAIQREVLNQAKIARDKGARTFKLDSKRSDKSFPYNHYSICAEGASLAYNEKILDVDVHHPDVTIMVEVREKCFVYSDAEKGCRGLPVGVSGKGLLLLSGGLDSPVAGYRMMRRGMIVDSCYFHAYPYTSDEAREKVETLAKIISGYGVRTHLNIIPFTEVQMQIKKKAPENFSTLMLRLCMMKCANMLADRLGSDCIITGESLGQVASQTAQNMECTESFSRKPLFRPLIGMDKEEIIADAIKIGTYETSILPYEDCCVLFSPKHPILHADVEEARRIYESLEIDALIQKAYDERIFKGFEVGEPIA
ncbi:MAG: tRNA 4-thiouridine(8) synthase ThiI [Treponema sp.]|nr:tRNA 4-thiouridine(8) synthase ThiI [Treponema sp.]